MKLVVFSHKPCWRSAGSASGLASDGGFPFQMTALAELFDAITVLVPCHGQTSRPGETPLSGPGLRVVPLPPPFASGVWRKLLLPAWCLRCAPILWRELRGADAVHAPIPGDVGTVGMLLGWLAGKPLFVRHCGNWLRPKTVADKFWRWFMEKNAGECNVMLATGGAAGPPSHRNPNVSWIFSSSLSQAELARQACPRIYPSDGRVRLIHVARQEMNKGAGLVIRSLPLLARCFPHVSLEIIGEGAGVPEFQRLAHDLRLADRINFAGRLSHEQVMEHLRTATLFVFPTTASEGFPKAVLEALASGLPVVATPVSVLPQLVGTGSGVLIQKSKPSPEAVAQAVQEALADAGRYEAMSRRAIEVARHYSLEAWREAIGKRLTAAWGALKDNHESSRSPSTARG